MELDKGTHRAALDCPHCGAKHQLAANVTAEFDGGPVDYSAPSDGDMLNCTDCGKVSFMDSTAPGGLRKACDPLEEMAATVAKMTVGRADTGDIKGYFRRRFEEVLAMGGDQKDCTPQARAMLQAMYATALLDIFKLVHETASAGGSSAVARLKAYKRDAYAFAEYAGEYAAQTIADAAAAKAAEENKQ